MINVVTLLVIAASLAIAWAWGWYLFPFALLGFAGFSFLYLTLWHVFSVFRS